MIERQLERFGEAYRLVREAGLDPLRHLANSADTLTRACLDHAAGDDPRAGAGVSGHRHAPVQAVW